MTLTEKHAPVLAILISAGLLIGAWIFQYGFDYPPCEMCYWQRHAHKVVLVIAAIALTLNLRSNGQTKLFNYLLALALLGSFAMAFWHVGVEYKWWEGPKTCSGGGVLELSEDPLAALDKPIRGPACSEALWHFLGLSMAAWNGIISLGGAALMLLFNRTGGHNA